MYIHTFIAKFHTKLFYICLTVARCFAPSRLKCGGITHPHPDFELGKWSYDASSKTCTPLYMPREQQNFCPDYMVLPQTKKECEDLCGEHIVIIISIDSCTSEWLVSGSKMRLKLLDNEKRRLCIDICSD